MVRAANPQDGMLSRDAGVHQNDVGAWGGADTVYRPVQARGHAAMKAGRALEQRSLDGDDETAEESQDVKEDIIPLAAIF